MWYVQLPLGLKKLHFANKVNLEAGEGRGVYGSVYLKVK